MRRAAATLALFALVSFAAGCDGLPGKPSEADRYRRPSKILDFTSLYATNCSGCHGEQGTLGPARPLADPLYLRWVGRARLRAVIARGVPGTTMPSFLEANGGTLTAAQVDALTDGLFETWARPAATSASASADERLPDYAAASPGLPERGRDAYAKHCADCHGADGLGGEKGGPVLDPSFLALVSDQMLRSAIVIGRRDLGMPDWREVSQTPMTEREIRDVVAWMSERRP